MPDDTTPSPNDTYQSPLASRYASDEMKRIWSARYKFETWRKIWLAAAEAMHAVTKDWPTTKDRPVLVTKEQCDELRANLDVTDADIARAAELEAELRHDVMAHVHAWGERCPLAKPIIHLGMTSQDINDNCELLILTEGIKIIDRALDRLYIALGHFAERYKSLPTLAFTHYQPAQPTTVGRRAIGWAHDIEEADRTAGGYWMQTGHTDLRGFRGATGTQASYLALFDGEEKLVQKFEALAILGFVPEDSPRARNASRSTRAEAIEGIQQRIARYRLDGGGWGTRIESLELRLEELQAMTDDDWDADGYEFEIRERTFRIVNQTYPRVFDVKVLTSLAAICATLHKAATDIRLLCNRKELDEPFADKQIGSSAMPYKRNPMRCERVCGLARFVMNLVGNAYETAATQWLERTLDDSANRRLTLPEAFLATDACLNIMTNVISGLVVHEKTVRKNLMAELPFLATENILMEAVKRGGDRQDLHERIRVHAQAAGHRVKHEGLDNDLIQRLKGDPAFASVHELLNENVADGLLDPKNYVGLAIEQTERFLRDVIAPLSDCSSEQQGKPRDLRV